MCGTISSPNNEDNLLANRDKGIALTGLEADQAAGIEEGTEDSDRTTSARSAIARGTQRISVLHASRVNIAVGDFTQLKPVVSA